MTDLMIKFCGISIRIQCEQKLELENGIYSGVKWVPYLKQKFQDQVEIAARIYNDDLPLELKKKQTPKNVILDTQSTWAIYRTESLDWPYLFGFSLSTKTDLKIPAVLANRDFSEMRVYLGPSKNRTEHRLVSLDQIYPLDEVLFRHFIVQRKGLLLHGASLLVNASDYSVKNQGWVFLGDSGAGKSTIAELLESEISGAAVLTDDRTVVIPHSTTESKGIKNKGYEIFGTPWHGTLPRFDQRGVPLSHLFFIEQSKAHSLEELDPEDAFERLIKVYLGTWWLAEHRNPQIDALELLVKNPYVRFHRLGFAKERSVASFLLERLSKSSVKERDCPLFEPSSKARKISLSRK